MKIAMIGLKGIPAKWGGIEKYVEEIGKRLVKRGHEVTVFGSRWYCKDYQEKFYEGMKIVRVPTLHFQATDAISNGFLASFRIIAGNFDIAHFHGYASYYILPFVKAFGKKTVITAHGVESGWDNPKYKKFAQAIIKQAFRIGIAQSHSVTAVAKHIQRQINNKYHIPSTVAPSGIDEIPPCPPALIKERYGFKGNDYLLFLGRIDPIKRVDWLLDLPEVLGRGISVVIAGGAQDSSASAYLRGLKAASANSKGVVFTGPVQGQEKNELLSNCLAFVAPSQNEGLPVSLLEALSYGKCCIASNITAHKEILEDGATGFLFSQTDKSDFLKKVKYVMNLPVAGQNAIGKAARQRVKTGFSWERTTDLFETIYLETLAQRAKKK